MVERIASIKLNDDITIEAVFYSGIVKNFDVKNLFDRWPQYRVLKEDTAIWYGAKLLSQGSGVYFNDELDLTAEEIWNEGSFVRKVITKTILQLAFYIAKTREEMKLSQTQLSKKTGITQCDISRIEGGVANPTIETLSKICEALNLEIKVCRSSSN